MKAYSILVTALFAGAWLVTGGSIADAAPCLIVTLTGTQGGPQSFNGLAGAGTLVRYGDDTNECGTVKLQFDAGRGTTMRLSRLGIGPEQLNAVFFTHMHNDHTEGFAIWFNSVGLSTAQVQKSMPSVPLMPFRR